MQQLILLDTTSSWYYCRNIEGTFVIMSPSPNIGGTCPQCPIWIDAPEFHVTRPLIAVIGSRIVTSPVRYDIRLLKPLSECRARTIKLQVKIIKISKCLYTTQSHKNIFSKSFCTIVSIACDGRYVAKQVNQSSQLYSFITRSTCTRKMHA